MVLVGLTLAEAARVETARAQAEAMLAAPGVARGLFGSREVPLARLGSWVVWGFGAGPAGLASAVVPPLGMHTSVAPAVVMMPGWLQVFGLGLIAPVRLLWTMA